MTTSLVTDVHTADPHSEVLSVLNGLPEVDECGSNDSYGSASTHCPDEHECLLCHQSFEKRSDFDKHLLEHVQQPTVVLKRIDVPKIEPPTRSFARKHIRPYKNHTKINVDELNERNLDSYSPGTDASSFFSFDEDLPMVPKLRVLLPEQLSEQVDALESSRFSCSNSPIDDLAAGSSQSEVVLPDSTHSQLSTPTASNAEMVELSALPGDSQSPSFPSQSPSQPDRLSQHHQDSYWPQDDSSPADDDPLQLHDVNSDHRESGEKEAERHDSLLQNFLNDSVEPNSMVGKEAAMASNETEFISLERLAGPQCSTCGERFVDQAAFSEHCKSSGHFRAGAGSDSSAGVGMSLVPYGQPSALQHLQHHSPLDSLANLPMQQLAQQVNRLQQGQVHQQNVLINIQQFGQPMAPPPYRGADMPPHMQPHMSHYPPAQQPPPHHHHMYSMPPHQPYHPHGPPPPPPPHSMYYGVAGSGMYGPPPPPPQQQSHHPLAVPPPPRQQQQQQPPSQHQYHHRAGGSMMPPRLPPPSQQAQRMPQQQQVRGVQQQQQAQRAAQQQHFRTGAIHAPRGGGGGGRGGAMGHGNRSSAPPQQQQQQQQQVRAMQQARMSLQQQQNGQKRSVMSGSGQELLQAKKKRLDVLIPDTNDDADCHVISMQTCKDGLPVIKNVQGAATSADGTDPVVHLTDSITLSVRNPKEAAQGVQQQQQQHQQQQKKNDAKAVANILATRGITVTPASKPQKESAGGSASCSPTGKQPTPVAINLNSAVSIIPTARGQSGKVTSASPVSATSVCSAERTSVGATPPTVDLTDDGPGQKAGGKRVLPHQCDLCPAQYPNMRTLMIHRRQYHKAGPQSDLGVPIVDLSQTAVLSKLASLGIHSYIPLPQTGSGSSGTFALPIVSVNAARNPNVCNIGALGSGAVLTLGPLHHISNLPNSRQ